VDSPYLHAPTPPQPRSRSCARSAATRRSERAGTDPAAATALDRNLEIDALELAVVAGTTAVGGDPPEELLTYARDLAADYDGEFPPPGRALPRRPPTGSPTSPIAP